MQDLTQKATCKPSQHHLPVAQTWSSASKAEVSLSCCRQSTWMGWEAPFRAAPAPSSPQGVSWLQEPKGLPGRARIAWKGVRKMRSVETGSVLFARWIQFQARSIKELNLDFRAEIIATGMPRTLQQGSR